MKNKVVLKGYIARDKDGEGLYLYMKKPHKEGCGGRFWTDNETQASLQNELFPNVKWADEEPTEVEITIKRK